MSLLQQTEPVLWKSKKKEPLKQSLQVTALAKRATDFYFSRNSQKAECASARLNVIYEITAGECVSARLNVLYEITTQLTFWEFTSRGIFDIAHWACGWMCERTPECAVCNNNCRSDFVTNSNNHKSLDYIWNHCRAHFSRIHKPCYIWYSTFTVRVSVLAHTSMYYMQ